MSEDIIDIEEKELFENHIITVDKGQALLRIDKFLMQRVANTTRSKIQNACDAQSVLVNGKAVKSNYKVKPFDNISVLLHSEPREIDIIAENIPIEIVFEDDYLCVINKKPGMVVHPAYGNYTGTLVNALMYHFKNLPTSKTKLSNNKLLDRPGLVHRIDKNTSGIIIVAKTEVAMIKLAKCFFDRTLNRQYIALVWGTIKENEGTINCNVGRDLRNRKIMAPFPNSDIGKHAITHYKVIERFAFVTLVECKLETGRTHQIRIHMKHLGHPLFNDAEYGGDKILKGHNTAKYKQFVQNCFDILPRQALHAKNLHIPHPIKDTLCQFESPLPNDMSEVIEKWRAYS